MHRISIVHDICENKFTSIVNAELLLKLALVKRLVAWFSINLLC